MHQKGMVKNLKLRIEFDDSLQEEEIIIRCRELSPDIIQLKETLSNTLQKNEVISFFENFEQVNERFITMDDDILFDFLSERLPRLETYATIIYNEKFTIDTDMPLTVKAGYLKDINLLVVDMLKYLRLKK